MPELSYLKSLARIDVVLVLLIWRCAKELYFALANILAYLALQCLDPPKNAKKNQIKRQKIFIFQRYKNYTLVIDECCT